MKKILAFSSGLFLILALSSMNSNVTVSAKSADVQSIEESVTEVTEENWHVDGMDTENDSAPVDQEEQTTDVIAATQTVTEATAETVDGTADSVIPTIEAAATELNSQNEDEFADDIIPSVAAPETETEDVTEEIIFEEEDTPNSGVKEQGAVEVKGASVVVKGNEDSITSSGVNTEETVVEIEEENKVPDAAVLPQTGVVPASCFYGFGFLICAFGVCMLAFMCKKENK
ncbi:MAG: hypothetical protein K2N51_07805 [Lachnospiraceae bacterium]|nr:hypothetical protein [Lachnospiraceae bacterium]